MLVAFALYHLWLTILILCQRTRRPTLTN